MFDPGRAAGSGRPADLLFRLGCDPSGRRGQAGSLLVEALPLLPTPENLACPPLALVFGSGGGTEPLELLRRGWTVAAIDERESGAPAVARLTIDRTDIGGAVFPRADMIYSGAVLPFRSPVEFAALWPRIVRAIRPGGWFVGHLLGDRDSWSGDPRVTVFGPDQVTRLLSGFRIELLREEDENELSSAGQKRWHIFSLIARRWPFSSRGRPESTPQG